MKNIKIKISENAYQKLKYFTKECDTEISGLGKVIEREDDFLIYDIEIFKQTVSGASSDLDEEELVKFLSEKLAKNESVKDYKVWWHSHVYMGAFFSSIDDTTIDLSTEFPYLISIVINKHEEMQVRFDLYKPIRLSLYSSVEIELDNNEEIKESCKQEIKEKVIDRWSFKAFKPIIKGKKKYSTRKHSSPPLPLPDLETSDHKLELPSRDLG